MARPQWSERIDERGAPVDPLNANRSRNRFTNLFAHGTITSIPLRLRYLSVFCWAVRQLADDEGEEPYETLKNIEKLFCLASRYRQLQAGEDREVIRGMDGNSEFSLDEEEFDAVELDTLELLQNDGYAYAQFYENQLQNYLLKRGEFTLTEAGQDLARRVEATIGEDRERILSCAEEGRATRDDFEAFAELFANQAVYLDAACESERRALQKVLLGVVEWTGERQSGSVALAEASPGEMVTLAVLDRLHDVITEGEFEEVGTSNLFRRFHRGYHVYRGAHAVFLMRAWQLQNTSETDRLKLSERDQRAFQQYRELMRLYWLQVYAGYAVEAQLEALTTFLNARIPARYAYDDLLQRVVDPTRFRQAYRDVTSGLDVTAGGEAASSNQRTRNLMLYGTTNRDRLDVSVPDADAVSTGEIELGVAVSEMQAVASDGWDANPAVVGASTLNEVLLGNAIRRSLNGVGDAIDSPEEQFRWWTESLAQSVALLLLVVARFKQVRGEREWLYNYAYNRFDSSYASLPALTRFVEHTSDDVPLHAFARELVTDQVVETHLQVFYSRLSPGNLKRFVSFDQDERLCLEVDRDRGDHPYGARVSLVRFSELSTLLRDAGLLTGTEEGYAPTARGREILTDVIGDAA